MSTCDTALQEAASKLQHESGLRHRVLVMQINWAMNDKQEFVDITEVVYRGARKGRGLVVSPKGMP